MDGVVGRNVGFSRNTCKQKLCACRGGGERRWEFWERLSDINVPILVEIRHIFVRVKYFNEKLPTIREKKLWLFEDFQSSNNHNFCSRIVGNFSLCFFQSGADLLYTYEFWLKSETSFVESILSTFAVDAAFWSFEKAPKKVRNCTSFFQNLEFISPKIFEPAMPLAARSLQRLLPNSHQQKVIKNFPWFSTIYS